MTFREFTPYEVDRILKIIGIDPEKSPKNQGVSTIQFKLSKRETNKVLHLILTDWKRYKIPYFGNTIVQEDRAKIIIQSFVHIWLTIWSSE